MARRLREGSLTATEHQDIVRELDGDWPRYRRLIAGDGLVHLAGVLAEHLALRGFDAVHLASALQLNYELGDVQFLAFDDKLIRAARQLLPLYSESADDEPSEG